MDFAPGGDWALYDYVGGESLDETGPVAADSPRGRSLAGLIAAARALERESAIYLDLADDNIMFRGDEAILVDLGGTPAPVKTQALCEMFVSGKITP